MENINNPSVVINSIKFNNGKEINFKSDDIVLLVGANNVGKSRTLKDLRAILLDSGESTVLVDKVGFQVENFSGDVIGDYFERNLSRDVHGNYTVMITDDHQYCYNKQEIDNVSNNKRNFYKVFFSYLSTENRLNITKPIRLNYSIDRNCFNILKKLESSSEAINSLNAVLESSFEKAIDVYESYEEAHVVKGYKIAESQIINEIINLNTRDSKSRLKELEELYGQGDGIRSAVAILASLIVNEHSLFLIDEPETFLHPPQAKLIGKNIVELSKNKQCFIATHNIDFIKGIVEADSSRVKILKIDRTGNINAFNLVNNESIVEIANDKNLKYTNILDGLFYNRLVICENESDCKFYAAILESLDLQKYQNTLFCAVGGKDQFKKVIPLLKELSIQYLIIADIDLINNRGNVKQLLDSIEVNSYDAIKEKHDKFLIDFEENTNNQVKTQETIKKEINDLFTQEKYMSPESADKIKQLLKNISCLKLLKTGGKNILPQGDCVSLFNDIKNYLNDRNVFILDCGEIERFVPDVGGHGNDWLEKVFEKYDDINDASYNEAKNFIKTVFNIK